MIFVTVGTHEQAFDRLIKKIDVLKGNGIIQDDVVIQTGFSIYEPVFCKWKKLFPYQEMIRYVSEANVVITHGGPASFIMPLQMGKIPIVVPRQKKFDEHINDHQMEFCRAVEERQKNIIVVDDIERLEDVLSHYEELVLPRTSRNNNNNSNFIKEFNKIVADVFKETR